MQENITDFIFVGVAIVSLVVSIVRSVATKREVDALKVEIKDERERVDKIMGKQFDLIRGLTAETNERYSRLESSISTWQHGIERLIGKIEGKVDTK